MQQFIPPKEKLQIIVPTDWNTTKKGKFLEKLTADLMRFHYKYNDITPGARFTGMEVDLLAESKETQTKAFVECKFYRDNSNFVSDIIWKLMGQAWHHNANYAFLFSTVYPKDEAFHTIKAIRTDCEQFNKEPKLIFIDPDRLLELCVTLPHIKKPNFSQYGLDKIKAIYFVVIPQEDDDWNSIWLVEELGTDNQANSVLIFPSTEKHEINISQLTIDLLKQDLWSDIEDFKVIQNLYKSSRHNSSPSIEEQADKDSVCEIIGSDDFEDYSPCSSKYFVGRNHIQKKIWDFFNKIKSGEGKLRTIGIKGASGFGKSSLLIKLKEDCINNPELKEHFYIYNVDAKLTVSKFFVEEAINQAIHLAFKEDFIYVPSEIKELNNNDKFFYKNTFDNKILELLKHQKKVLIIFFDHFEQILSHQCFYDVYEIFEKIVIENTRIGGNIILGFCWRTDSAVSMRHQAFTRWSQLEEKRKEFSVGNFDEKEIQEFLMCFEKYLIQQGQKLLEEERNYVIDNCPGYPWLWKGVCIQIYENKLYGKFNSLPSKLDANKMFEDIHSKSVFKPEHHKCLKYIAENSPVPYFELINEFGGEVIEWLSSNRLVRQSANKYMITWDIYRDILLGKEPPIIPLLYKPTTTISTALNIFKLISNEKDQEVDLEKLLTQLNKNKKDSIRNSIRDLNNYCLVVREKNIIKVAENLSNCNNDIIADHLATVLQNHVVLKAFYEKTEKGKCITLKDFQKTLAEVCHAKNNINNSTPKDNSSRILSWLNYAGLIEYENNWWVYRPLAEGKYKGKLKEDFDDLQLPLW